MYFQAEAKQLIEGFKLAKKVINKKAILPILSTIKVDVTPGKVTFSCTNLEIALKNTIDAVTEGEGSFLLPLQVLATLKPKDGIITVRCPQNYIELQKSTGNIKVATDNVDDFPILPVDDIRYFLNSDFVDSISKCLPAVSTDESRYALCGVCIQRDAIVASDGRRLHAIETVLPEIFSDLNRSEIILPAKTANILVDVVKMRNCKEIGIGLNGKVIVKEKGKIHPIETQLARPKIESNSITFQIGNVTLTSRLIDDKFPNWRYVVPAEIKTSVTLSKEQLIDVLHDLQSYIERRHEGVTLFFNTNSTKSVDIYTTGSEKYYAEVPFNLNSNNTEPFGFIVNPSYILDALRSIDDNQISIGFNAPNEAILIESAVLKNGKFVVMPVISDSPVMSYAEFVVAEQKKLQETQETCVEQSEPDEQKTSDAGKPVTESTDDTDVDENTSATVSSGSEVS